jgi:hypothetical protein
MSAQARLYHYRRMNADACGLVEGKEREARRTTAAGRLPCCRLYLIATPSISRSVIAT